jgi:hypothetical protein
MSRIKRSEWVWVTVFAILVMALTSVPYLIGWAHTDANWHFSGFVIGVNDGNAYVADMQLGAHGQWLLQLPYAVEAHPGSLVYLFFILLGKLVGGLVGTADPLQLHDALVIGFHVARVVLGIGQILITYLFLAEMLPLVRQRRLALIVAILCGGLGWLLLAIPQLGQPLEFYSPEAFSFLHLYSLPHLEAVRVLMLGGFLCYLKALKGRWRWALAAGGLWFLMTLVQPFYMVIVYGVLAVQIVILGVLAFRQGEGELTQGVDMGATALRAIWMSLIAGVFGLPLVIYTFLLFIVDPIYQIWGAQNIILSPSPWHYLSAWGLCVLAGLFGLRSLYRRQPLLWTLLVGWMVLVPFLLYVPYNLQRRFSEGLYVPLAGLAILGLTIGFGKAGVRRRVSRLGPLFLIALTLPATGLVWVGGVVAASVPKQPVYQAHDQVNSYIFLAKSLPARGVVLSGFDFGNAIPAYGYLVAYIGHGPETPNLPDKEAQAGRFYDPTTPSTARLEIYQAMGQPYIIVSPQEKANGFDPARLTDYLVKLYESGDYSVWTKK